jgi:predicted nucleotidyltransferase
MLSSRVPIDRDKIEAFCRRWGIAELSLFGSVLRQDFREDSDIDVLVSFLPETTHGLFELVDMQDQMAQIFGRRVDLVLRRSVERSKNPYRREAILSSAQLVYGSR